MLVAPLWEESVNVQTSLGIKRNQINQSTSVHRLPGLRGPAAEAADVLRVRLVGGRLEQNGPGGLKGPC